MKLRVVLFWLSESVCWCGLVAVALIAYPLWLLRDSLRPKPRPQRGGYWDHP